MSLQDDIFDVRSALKDTEFAASFERIETALANAENLADDNLRDAGKYRQLVKDISLQTATGS